jgi:hypothetical protein
MSTTERTIEEEVAYMAERAEFWARRYPAPPWDLEDVMRRNADAGQHFFDPATMRFFASRLCGPLYGRRFFVTSERCTWGDYPRLYSIREAMPNGHVDDVSPFQFYTTGREAKRDAARLAAELGDQTEVEA